MTLNLCKISFWRITNAELQFISSCLIHNTLISLILILRKNKCLKRCLDCFRMPNENVCACGVVVDLPKSRSSSVELLGKLTILLPKTRGNRSEGKSSRKQHDDGRVPKTRTPSEIGSSSTVTEPTRSTVKNSKHEKRLTHSRRTRSAERAESHYTYIGQLVRIKTGFINIVIMSKEFMLEQWSARFATFMQISDSTSIILLFTVTREQQLAYSARN